VSGVTTASLADFDDDCTSSVPPLGCRQLVRLSNARLAVICETIRRLRSENARLGFSIIDVTTRLLRGYVRRVDLFTEHANADPDDEERELRPPPLLTAPAPVAIPPSVS
jgi:hypothetical protein